MKRLSVAAFAMAFLPMAAFAASPPTTALFGSVAKGADVVIGLYSCSSDAAPIASTYIRPVPAGPITVDLGFLQYRERQRFGSGDKIRDVYSGGATLNFSTATTGTILWDYAYNGRLEPGARSVPFSAFSQSYNPATHLLRLTFSVDFGACSIPVKGTFHG